MKRLINSLVSCLLLILLFTSCNRIVDQKNDQPNTPNSTQTGDAQATSNSAMKNLGFEDQDEKTLAVIRNFPDEDTLKKMTQLETFESDQGTETLLLIPVVNGSTIEIKSLEWDNENLKETGSVYKAEKTKDGYGLYLRAVRPEGAPLLKIIVESPTGDRGEYLVTYNGKDGTPDIEVIQSKE